jgi:hypothetical protein
MKRLVLGATAMLLVLTGSANRPVHACPIGYNPGTCNTAQCHSACQAEGLTGGTCWYHACTVSCTCLN